MRFSRDSDCETPCRPQIVPGNGARGIDGTGDTPGIADDGDGAGDGDPGIVGMAGIAGGGGGGFGFGLSSSCLIFKVSNDWWAPRFFAASIRCLICGLFTQYSNAVSSVI